MTTTCPQCQTPLPRDATHCTHCGRRNTEDAAPPVLLAPEQIDWQEPAEVMPSSVPPEARREASAVVLRCTQCYWVESHPANEEPRCTHCGGSAEVLQPVLPAVEEDTLPAGQDPRVSVPAASSTVPSVVPSVAAETRQRAGKATVFQPASSFPPARERKTITTVRPNRPEQKAPAGQLAGTQISGTQATSAQVSGAHVSGNALTSFAADIEEAYQRATSLLDHDDEPQQPPKNPQQPIPDRQKHVLFLRPGERPARSTAQEPSETASGTASKPASASSPAAPPSTEGATDRTAAGGATVDRKTSALAAPPRLLSQKKAAHPRHPRRSAPVRQRYRLRTALLVLLFLVPGCLAGGFVWWTQQQTKPSRLESAAPVALTIHDDLEGRFLLHKPSKRRLLVVEGSLTNNFADADQISWVRLRGTMLSDEASSSAVPPAVAITHSYLGNRLDEATLLSLPIETIRRRLNYSNGSDDVNWRLTQGERVPFQLVFVGIESKPARTEVEVESYLRRGQQIDVTSSDATDDKAP